MAFGNACPQTSWEAWCDCSFSADDPNFSKCYSKPMGLLTAPPWTTIGAAQRGIPQDPTPWEQLVEVDPGDAAAPSPDISSGFGIPSKVLLVGGAVLVAGVLALSMKKGRSLGEYRRKRRRKSRR